MTNNVSSSGRSKTFTKEKLLYPFYVLKHPSDGFYEIRHREKGSVLIALIILVLFSASYTLNREFASFVVNDINPKSINSIMELEGVALLFFLFCVANWSITCLMEGEGRLKDIVTVSGYAMLPMVLAFVPATILSQFIAANEQAFYQLIMTISVIYFVILLLMGIMTVHNFTLGKTLFTLVLTALAMFLIIFLGLLFYSLIDSVVGFFKSIYIEMLFRT
ncbi:MAG: Yip1 domain [Anaerocolumna sp.]|jgi:hypothetical protein|nr:Yip1 domain [Anaerocolumna sp.]